jgi:hypothetical protein
MFWGRVGSGGRSGKAEASSNAKGGGIRDGDEPAKVGATVKAKEEEWCRSGQRGAGTSAREKRLEATSPKLVEREMAIDAMLVRFWNYSKSTVSTELQGFEAGSETHQDCRRQEARLKA